MPPSGCTPEPPAKRRLAPRACASLQFARSAGKAGNLWAGALVALGVVVRSFFTNPNCAKLGASRLALTAALALTLPACFESLSSLSDGLSGDSAPSDGGSAVQGGDTSIALGGSSGGGGPSAAAGANGSVALGGASSGGASSGGAGSGAQNLGGTAGAAFVCTAAPEVCDGVDNDCDGVVDEGCPSSLTWDTAVKQTTLGDSSGGDEFSDTCAGDEVLAGVNVTAGSWVDSVQAVCRKLTFSTSGTPFQYSVSLGATHTLSVHPQGVTSAHQDLICSGNDIVVGLRISQQNYTSSSGSASVVVPKLWITCAEPVLKLDSNPPGIAWQSSTEMGPAAGSFADDTAWFETDQLTSPKVLVGFQGNAGSWVDRVGVATADVALTFSPKN